jgi:hypothetical protein
VERCAALLGESRATLGWVAGHDEAETLECELNCRSDRAATEAFGSPVEDASPPAPRPRRLLAAATVVAVGVEAEARATRVLRGVAAADALRRLRTKHPALPAARALRVHHAPLRIARWHGLRALPAASAPSRWQAALLRRARGGGFAVYAADAECELCGESLAGGNSAERWEHALTCTAAKHAPIEGELVDAVRTAAARRAVEQLRTAQKSAAGAAALLAEEHAVAIDVSYAVAAAGVAAAGQPRRAAAAAALPLASAGAAQRVPPVQPAGAAPPRAAGTPPAPRALQPARRRQRPPRLAAVGALHAARDALAAGEQLAGQTVALLHGASDDRAAVLLAMHPGAVERRGDGVLLCALAQCLTRRAEVWLTACDVSRGSARSHAARAAAVVAATALLGAATAAPTTHRRRRRRTVC